MTTDLVKRVYEHKNDLADGFTKTYGVHMLVYFEAHDEVAVGITREKQIKKWNRAWKIKLIEQDNPEWQDLYEGLL